MPKPKDGVSTSSFKVLMVSALTPVLLFLAIIAGLVLVDEPRVREALVNALVYVVLPGILGSAAVGWKYVEKRGDVSVALVEASARPNAAATTNVNISQDTKE